MLAALVLITGVWNRISDFKTAYLQALLFLEVMNVYDGIVIDKIWVGYSKFWLLPGCEDIPYVQTWGQVFKIGILYEPWILIFRIIGTVLIVLGAAVWYIGALRSDMDDSITENRLQTKGIYSWVRNSMYSGWRIALSGITMLWHLFKIRNSFLQHLKRRRRLFCQGKKNCSTAPGRSDGH